MSYPYTKADPLMWCWGCFGLFRVDPMDACCRKCGTRGKMRQINSPTILKFFEKLEAQGREDE